MKTLKAVTVLLIGVLNQYQASAQSISSNGYSGLGLVPSASTLSKGLLVISNDSSVPGRVVTNGYNNSVAFGLTENLEVVGRLATNNQKCNLFKTGDCPTGTYRDFSSSMKWSLPIDWLKQNNSSLAVGVTDFGGAATYFRSYYLVGNKEVGELDVSLGQAKAKVPTAMLDGTMASLTWKPSNSFNATIQKVGESTTAHAKLKKQILSDGMEAWVTLNHRISDLPVMDKSWVGWGVSIPLDRVEKRPLDKDNVNQGLDIEHRELKKLKPTELKQALEGAGFYNPKIGIKGNDQLLVELENTAYVWNALDAAGVALGIVASAYTSVAREQNFDLVITTRGIKQLKVTGEAICVGRWLSTGEVCHKLQVQSLLQNSTESEQWASGTAWQFRPEIIISPTLLSAVGTEYGSFDFDMGANINTVLPLWKGATVESNRVEPLGVGTRQFEQGGAFFGSRLKPVTSRRLFHQLMSLPSVNTQARLSFGTAYTNWEGQQIETSTQTNNGHHKFGYTGGTFKNDSLQQNSEKNYRLLNYRYVNNEQQTSVTEITQGKFWGGDKGFSINQRFWYGDTTLNVYFRRSRMGEGQPLVSFAGLQFAIPFTPRENKSLEHLGFRGVSQWTYSLETKVLEKDNIITGGYGEVPRIGDSLVTTFNRDRNSTRYFDTNLSRMRNAYLNLGNN